MSNTFCALYNRKFYSSDGSSLGSSEGEEILQIEMFKGNKIRFDKLKFSVKFPIRFLKLYGTFSGSQDFFMN